MNIEESTTNRKKSWLIKGLLFSGLILFGILLSVLLTPACFLAGKTSKIVGNGIIKTEVRALDAGFDAIDAGGAYILTVECQKKQKLEITAEENILPLIKTHVKNGTLIIECKEKIKQRKDIEISVQVPNLSKIEISGATKADVSNLNNKSIKIISSGASKINLSGKTKDLCMESSGSSKVTLNGAGKKLKVESSGASNIDGEKFPVKQADINMSGSGKACINCIEDLHVNISGAGNLTYTGNPRITKEISGVGIIRKK